MKNRYRIVRNGSRADIFYAHDNVTGLRESLETKDKTRAFELLTAKNESAREPAYNLQKARIYLAASDPDAATRSWRTALSAVIESKPQGSENRHRWRPLPRTRPSRLSCHWLSWKPARINCWA